MRFTFLILLVCVLKSISGSEENQNGKRTLETYVNPQCDIEKCKTFKNDTADLSIVYIKSSSSVSDKDKAGPDIHFVLSTYEGSPAFFIVKTKINSSLKINWTQLVDKEENSIEFHDNDDAIIKPSNTIGVLINKLFLWSDENESADYVPFKNAEKPIEYNDLKWKNVTILNQSAENVHVEFALKEKVANGTIRLRLMVSSDLQKYSDLPHLLFTSRSVHTQLVFDGFQELFNNSAMRLGMQMTITSKGQAENPISSDTFDDEDSPGLFTRLKYPFGLLNGDASFLSFKPNAYSSEDRLIAQTIDSRQSDLSELKERTTILEQNNAFAGFYKNNSNVYAYQMYITFGSKGQDFYSKTNHTEFSFVFGLNDLPEPSMSLFIRLVIIIGSGLSLLVLLIFPISICLMARKMKNRNEAALLNNQDSIY